MTIYIVNPNSSQLVTDGIDKAVQPLRRVSPVPIICQTLAEGPPAIESQAHIDAVIAPLVAHCAGLKADASAFVIACFSDPGLAELRRQLACPVLGIAESAVLSAMGMGQRFGIISILSASVPRHLRYLRNMGVANRLAADLPLEMGVLELADQDRTFSRLTSVGAKLRDQHGADVLILGCAGMAQYRTRLQGTLGLDVVDPCQAAAAMALGRIALSGANS